MRRWLVRAAALILMMWGAAIAALLFFRHDLIYPFRDWPLADQVSGLPGAEVVRIEAADDTPLVLWQVAPRQGKPTILYFMGNAGSLPSAGPRLTEFALQGYGIVALNYRGAGGMPGAPSQEVLTSDALLAYDLASGNGPPVIYGTSLGAAIAVQVASQRPARALVLETPFAQTCEAAQYHYPLIPACAVMWDERWESIEAIVRVSAPILIQHGDADRLIPLEQGQRLFDAAPEPKRLIVYPGGRHNDLRLHGAGTDALAFIAALPD